MHSYRNHTEKKSWDQTMNDCRLQGRTAARVGVKKITDNPFKLGTHRHNAWEAGYLAFQQEKADGKV